MMHGSAEEDWMVRIVADVRITLHVVKPETVVEPPPPLPPPCTVQVLGAEVQTYTLAPAGASVLRNISPIEQVAGSCVPALAGLVEAAPEKSIGTDVFS